jgi:hypothetical protein
VIRHIVLFSMEEPDEVDDMIESLERLRLIPQVLGLSCSRNLASSDFDAALIVDVQDDESLQAYRQHPDRCSSAWEPCVAGSKWLTSRCRGDGEGGERRASQHATHRGRHAATACRSGAHTGSGASVRVPRVRGGLGRRGPSFLGRDRPAETALASTEQVNVGIGILPAVVRTPCSRHRARHIGGHVSRSADRGHRAWHEGLDAHGWREDDVAAGSSRGDFGRDPRAPPGGDRRPARWLG